MQHHALLPHLMRSSCTPRSSAAAGSNCHLCVRRYASRSIRFPRQADLSNIKASYDNGVLKLIIPKKQVSNWRM